MDFGKGMLADVPVDETEQHSLYEKGIHSQHTNIFGILTGAIPEDDQKEIMENVLKDRSLIQATIYFRFYLFEALKKVGMEEEYTSMLGSWERMLENGLTTFQEGDYKDRSDCHAWSASPLYHFLTLVAGISPAEPGFQSVLIRPSLGDLEEIEAAMPHPQGMIRVSLKRKGKEGLTGTVTLPGDLQGWFQWKGEEVTLVPGSQEIRLK
jgi:alpha-L-rhamnosidase